MVSVQKITFGGETLQDPYPMYARMHEEGPLHFLDVDGQWGAWAIFSHAECSSIAKDPRFSAKRAQQMLCSLPLSSQPEFKELARMLSLWLIFMDPPEHTRLRKLLNKGFSPAAIEACVRKSRPSSIACSSRCSMAPKSNSCASSRTPCRCASFRK